MADFSDGSICGFASGRSTQAGYPPAPSAGTVQGNRGKVGAYEATGRIAGLPRRGIAVRSELANALAEIFPASPEKQERFVADVIVRRKGDTRQEENWVL
jgi:hypothetical protein